MNAQVKSLNEVIWLRVFAIITLVAWHSYCSYICWGIADSPLNVAYSRVFRLIAPIAQMPLFTFVSGYLFYYLHEECRKYRDFKGFLHNKARRLLIPYLVLGFVINMTQINRMHPIDLFWGTPNHMWYCLMLFYCFIVCWFVENKIGRWFNYLLAIASFGFVTHWGGQFLEKSPLGLFISAYYYCFFYMGFIVYSKRRMVLKYTKYLLPFILVLYALTIWNSKGGHLQGLTAVLFIIIILFIACQILSEPPKWIKTLSTYSFGIFVFHQWIIWNVTRWEPMSVIINVHYISFPILLFIGVFSVSLILTHYSLKTKVGRYLLA